MSKRLASPAGWTRVPLGFTVIIPGGTSAGEFVTDADYDFMFEVEKVLSHTTVVATGSGATRVFRVVKNASTVVATATIPLADMSTLGEQTAWTVTDDGATNHFEPGDTLTVDTIASGAVAFTAGEFDLDIILRTKPQTQN